MNVASPGAGRREAGGDGAARVLGCGGAFREEQ